MQWFGTKWNAPVCSACTQAKTPVGLTCTRCGQPIIGGNQGLILPALEVGAADLQDGQTVDCKLAVYHLGCFLAAVLPGHGDSPGCA